MYCINIGPSKNFVFQVFAGFLHGTFNCRHHYITFLGSRRVAFKKRYMIKTEQRDEKGIVFRKLCIKEQGA